MNFLPGSGKNRLSFARVVPTALINPVLSDAELLQLLGDLLLFPDKIVVIITVLTYIEDANWMRTVLLLYRARATSMLVEVVSVVKDTALSLLLLAAIG